MALAEVASTNAQAPDTITNASLADTNRPARFTVNAYTLKGETVPSPEAVMSAMEKHTGTNLTAGDLVQAASDLQSEYARQGHTNLIVAIAQDQITNGIVTMNVFRGHVPQILVSGRAYPGWNGPLLAAGEPGAAGQLASGTAAATNAAATNAAANTKTNAGPRFTVRAYEIRGDSLLTVAILTSVLVKYTGTNVGISDIVKAASELQMEYRDRGYPTVSVTIPQQQLTNGIVKFRVFEGHLSEILVVSNRFYSSNNVMRALPSLKDDMIINGPVFQGELDRANANQDRQIYPQIEPGDEVNTTRLRLEVRDRLPLHAKTELNNESSPGTPELRINSSMVYNNLWQHEHSVGLQYSFSPEEYKQGDWPFYDKPLVANYSAFYRVPIGNPEPLTHVIEAQPGKFGYDEATRKFQLPAPSGQPDLNFYASRSTIDTGLETLFSGVLFNTNGNTLTRQDVQRDLTITGDVGFRLTVPLGSTPHFQSSFSTGLDYKDYELTSYKTNIFTLSSVVVDTTSNPGHPQTNINHSVDFSPVPTTARLLDYLPFAVRWDGSEHDDSGTTTLGLGWNANLWYLGSRENLDLISGSRNSTGYWVTMLGNFERDQNIFTNWTLALRGSGQVATEPLISNEQFGIGGVNSVRGYREGEVFGDMGWWMSAEQRTPPVVVGMAYAGNPLVLRGSVFMDYGEAYLLDAHRRDSRLPLWGVGLGGAASIGSHWEARLLFSWPLISTSTTHAGDPKLNFALSAQF